MVCCLPLLLKKLTVSLLGMGFPILWTFMLVHLEFAFCVISNTITGVITSLEKRGGVDLPNPAQALVSLGPLALSSIRCHKKDSTS